MSGIYTRIEQKVDRILALAEKFLNPPDIRTPVTPRPPPSGIDYSRFAGMTPQQVLLAVPNGLPAGWDWNAAFAAGVLNPDAAKPPTTGTPTVPPQAGVLPWNGPGQGVHIEVRTAARLTITPPAGYSGSRQLDVSNIAPGQPDRVKMTLDGVPLDVPFAGGLINLPPMVGGRVYVLDVTIEPVGFGVSLQIR